MYRLFGVTLSTDFPFVTPLEAGTGPAELSFLSPSAGIPGELAESTPVFRGLYDTEFGRQVFELHQSDTGFLMRFADTGEFLVSEREVRCRPVEGAPGYAVEAFFLGMVMSLWLESRGVPCLHASAVAIEGRVVAFVGHNGAGKSALAGAMVGAGMPLVSDDIVALTPASGAMLAPCSYPRLRLWPEEAAELVPKDVELVPAKGGNPKLTPRVGGATGWGTYAAEALPLGAICLLERREGEHEKAFVRFEPVGAAAGLIELVRHSFAAEALTALGWEARRLLTLAEVVRRVPLWKIVYSSGRRHLDVVRRRIVHHLRSHGERPVRQG
ncbi:MAG: hypothetical protein JW820_06160 [Spirochaetales bacterium]|nr:hypothetical protein [Spirochaetales bacterium]